jgi:hypothetical protein
VEFLARRTAPKPAKTNRRAIGRRASPVVAAERPKLRDRGSAALGDPVRGQHFRSGSPGDLRRAIRESVAATEIGYHLAEALLDADGRIGSRVEALVEGDELRRFGPQETIEVLAHPGLEMKHPRSEEGSAVVGT